MAYYLLCSRTVAVCMFTRWADITMQMFGRAGSKDCGFADPVSTFPIKAGSEESPPSKQFVRLLCSRSRQPVEN
jgi:hypothetical protein